MDDQDKCRWLCPAIPPLVARTHEAAFTKASVMEG